jgi:hypothetical protein
MGRDRTSARGRSLRLAPAKLEFGFLVRMLALASFAIVGSVWGLVRYYTHVRPPMTLPAPPDAGSADAESDLIPIELEPR